MKKIEKILALFNTSLDRISSEFISVFQNIKIAQVLVISISLIVTGQVIYSFQYFKYFHIYQSLVIVSIIISTLAIKRFLLGVEDFKRMTASHPIKFIGISIVRLIHSKWCLPGILVISSLFIYSSIILGYVHFNLIGYYGLLMIVLMMLTATLGQTVYVYFIILLRKLLLANDFKYNFYIPAKTDWIVRIAKSGRMLNNAFFILGFIYTLIYYLNVPPNFIKLANNPQLLFWNNFQIDTPNNHLFILSWIVIFIIIIVAFPTYYFLQTFFLRNLIRKLKDRSIGEIQKLMKAQELSGKDNIDIEIKYFTLMTNIESSPKNPLESYNIIPVVSSLCSISVHIIKISESLLL